MVASGVRSSETSDDGFDELRTRCERCIGLLDEISRIHLEIDTPTRKMQADEPDWIYRLRKVCLHVMAIKGWNIGPDVEQVMASELRAAYEQVGAVWKDLPKEFRLEEMDGDWWAKEAKNGVLATYDHPTPQRLLLPAGRVVHYSSAVNTAANMVEVLHNSPYGWAVSDSATGSHSHISPRCWDRGGTLKRVSRRH